MLYDVITFGAGVIKDNVTVWREYSSTFDTVIDLLEQAFGAVKNLTFGFLGMSGAIDSTKKTGLSLTDSLSGGLKAMSASLTATAAAVGATDTALKNVKNLTLPELTAKLNEAKNAYALLGVEGQKTAKGLALAAERDAIQKQIDSINGKKEAAPKAAKKVEEPLIVGGIREAEKVLKALEDKLQNTKLDTPVAAAIAAKVVEAKKELERLKKVYDEFFADPTKKAAEAAKDNRDTRATANDRRAVADNVEPSVAKQIQLENERRYQFELTTIYVAGSKERKEAEKELAKVDLEIIKAANEDKKQIEKETEKERVEAEKQRLEAIKELRLKYDAERANDIELINNDEKANEADKKVFLLEAEQKYWTSILSIQGVALKDRIADQNKSNETELKLAAAKVVRRREIEKQIVGAAKDVGKTILQLDADFTEAEKNNRLNALDDERNKKLAAAGNDTEKRAQIEKEYDAKKAAIEKEAAQRNQKNALATAILNGALAVTSILAQYPKFDGGILMAIALAAAVAATAGQIAVISSQKFGRGGKLEGRSHSDGGETATVGRNRIQLEGGEGILNTRTMSSGGFAAVASYLNEAGGGVSFSNTKLPELLKSQILDFANGRFVLPNVPSLVVARQTPIVVQQAYYQNINTKNLEQIGAKTNALLERISKNAGINRETQKTYF